MYPVQLFPFGEKSIETLLIAQVSQDQKTTSHPGGHAYQVDQGVFSVLYQIADGVTYGHS